jgi:hypothetical protein
LSLSALTHGGKPAYGACKPSGRNCKAERLGGLEIDCKFELRRLSHRKDRWDWFLSGSFPERVRRLAHQVGAAV